MPNVTEVPMNRSESMTISEETAYAKFSGPSGHIEVISTINRGIQIRSKYKSEEMTIGINDHYLASVTYRSKTFPIYIALAILFGAVSFYFYLLAIMESDNEVAMLAGFIFTIFSIICIGSYFSSKRARLSFRLADEQDYDILLTSKAIQDSDLMQLFIQKILMNSLNVEGFVTDLFDSLDDQYNYT
tara:strand:+ start:97 stop:657 length:561 start_codon:yes stop_codon:yes gene_type:complete